MPTYDVSVWIEGSVRVEAESPDQAKKMAQAAPIQLGDARLLEQATEAEVKGEVTQLQPDNIRQKVKAKLN